ncbi:hypothetical protein Trydic_g1433 [Trypoxylus dichotomus]
MRNVIRNIRSADFGPSGQCISVCPNGCLYGQCYGVSCNCKRGFTLELNGRYCVPECTKNCGAEDHCVADNQCKCQAGYELNHQGVCQIICGSGYRAEGNVCEPQCIGGCLNGKCIAPGQCICNPGYNLEGNNICKPKCMSPCSNGFCSAPNICTCSQGYVKDTSNPKNNVLILVQVDSVSMYVQTANAMACLALVIVASYWNQAEDIVCLNVLKIVVLEVNVLLTININVRLGIN